MPQNGIEHKGILALAKALASNPSLRILNLNDNIFSENGAQAMAEVSLKKHWQIQLLFKIYLYKFLYW